MLDKENAAEWPEAVGTPESWDVEPDDEGERRVDWKLATDCRALDRIPAIVDVVG